MWPAAKRDQHTSVLLTLSWRFSPPHRPADKGRLLCGHSNAGRRTGVHASNGQALGTFTQPVAGRQSHDRLLGNLPRSFGGVTLRNGAVPDAHKSWRRRAHLRFGIVRSSTRMVGCLIERPVRLRQSGEMAFEHHERRNLRHFRQVSDRRPDALDGADIHSFRFDDQVDGPSDRMDRDDAGNFAQLGKDLRAGSARLVLDEEMGRGSPSSTWPTR